MAEIQTRTWQRLYELAREFRRLAPWEWTYDSDLFGVENPETGEIGYCCVMGMAGEFYGMAIYRGDRGLYNYEKLQGLNVDKPVLLARGPMEQDCLMLDFGSVEDLQEAEIKRLKSLGLRFRGQTHWPRFLDYLPGYAPHPIEEEAQAQFIIVGLEQAMALTKRLRSEGDLLDESSSKGQTLLIRRSKVGTEGLNWFDTWEDLQQPPAPAPPFHINTLYLRSNLSGIQQTDKTWIIDIFYLPAPIADGPRPYFSTMWLVIDADSRAIIGYDLFSPWELENGLQASFVRIVRDQAYLPEKIAVHVPENLPWLRELANTLDIELYLDTRLTFIDEVKMGLFGSMTTEQ